MTKPIIELENVTKKFKDKTIVDNISFKVKKGEILGFLGPNGAGKSTSINMIVGLLIPTSGNIYINQEDFKKVDKDIIGFCPQEITLWEDLTCKENLMFIGQMYEVPKKKLESRVDELLDKLQLTNKANTKIDDLSGGMKRRMNILMALVHDPNILILDEPSEGLDPQSRLILWDYIKYLKEEEEKTIILTTHLMDEADRLSDNVLIIDHGKILKLDTPENLKKSIGEGDILEILLSNPEDNEKLREIFENIDYVKKTAINDDKLHLTILNAVNKLPDIINLINHENITMTDISIRQNTLEDVFIELTGRQLRE